MGDVNFLGNEKKTEEKPKVTGKEDIKWSEARNNKVTERNKEKKNNVNGDDISSWLNSLKDEGQTEAKGVRELKKSKEALVEYQKVFQENRKKAELNEGIKSVVDKEELKEKSQGGIAEIIKRKLSFGGKKEGGFSTLKTNLIQSEGVTYFDWKEKTKVLVINVVLTFLIIGIAYGYLDYRERVITQKTQEALVTINSLKAQIASAEKDAKEIDVFQKKVKVVSDLLDKHIYWTNFFTFLEKNLLSSVYLDSNFDGTVGGDFSLSSKAKNFTDLTDQVRVMEQNDNVISANVTSGEVEGGEGQGQEVKFNLKLLMKPSIFYK